MAILFQHVLRVSLFMAPVILLLLLLTPRLGRRYAARLRCFLWEAAAIRLLIPYHFSLRTALRSLWPAENLLDRVDRSAVAAALRNILPSEAAQVASAQTTEAFTVDWNLVGFLWLVGAALFLCVNIVMYGITVKRLRRWSVPVTDPTLRGIFEGAKRELSVNREIGFYQAAGIASPLLAGLFRPAIYIPDRETSAAELSDVLVHELWHCKRHDVWLKLLFLLASAVHWFNPVVYLMLRQAEADVEIACDSDAMRGRDFDARKRYANTILSFVKTKQPMPMPLTTHFFGGKKLMMMRISDIITRNKKKSGAMFAVFFGLLIMLGGSLFGFDAAAAPTEAPAPEPTVNATTPAEDVAPIEITVAEPASEGLPPAIPDELHPFDGTFSGEMAWPVPDFYTLTSEYGFRYEGADFHTGMDIAGDTVGTNVSGAPVIAAADGIVVSVNDGWVGYGHHVILDHGSGVTTLYAHLSEMSVSVGDKVEQGQVIAKVGSTGNATGPLLHFEVREEGTHVDPASYLLSEEAR